ncbi:hypothetical protein QAD02_020227 [Eretmocerus hayati]|uniref:Uncharacterized protein n=1 Tax=Eretmocerus hayati TaxID=131215 RepID=A0ACC2PRM3_9HYME|nr:hypothetical protein QAD02_020227 [Eretmocerus hayati]
MSKRVSNFSEYSRGEKYRKKRNRRRDRFLQHQKRGNPRVCDTDSSESTDADNLPGNFSDDSGSASDGNDGIANGPNVSDAGHSSPRYPSCAGDSAGSSPSSSPRATQNQTEHTGVQDPIDASPRVPESQGASVSECDDSSESDSDEAGESDRGASGCQVCKIKGVRLNGVQTYPYTAKVDMRTSDKSLKHAEEALKNRECTKNKRELTDVFGVKGFTELSKLVYKYIETFTVDIMHCGYVGLAKRLGSLWFDSEYHECSFSLTKFLNIINKRISEIAPPSFVPRLPRSVADICYWKASELKVFLLIYSLPLLHDIIG